MFDKYIFGKEVTVLKNISKLRYSWFSNIQHRNGYPLHKKDFITLHTSRGNLQTLLNRSLSLLARQQKLPTVVVCSQKIWGKENEETRYIQRSRWTKFINISG